MLAWCRCIDSCILCLHINAWKKKHVDLIAYLKFVKMQHFREMEWIWTFHEMNVVRLVGPQAAQARPEWAMLTRGISLLGQSSRYMAMIKRPVLTRLFKTWSMIIVLIPVYDILISLHFRHSSTPNSYALNYWLAYTMVDTYLLMVL